MARSIAWIQSGLVPGQRMVSRGQVASLTHSSGSYMLFWSLFLSDYLLPKDHHHLYVSLLDEQARLRLACLRPNSSLGPTWVRCSLLRQINCGHGAEPCIQTRLLGPFSGNGRVCGPRRHPIDIFLLPCETVLEREEEE